MKYHQNKNDLSTRQSGLQEAKFKKGGKIKDLETQFSVIPK